MELTLPVKFIERASPIMPQSAVSCVAGSSQLPSVCNIAIRWALSCFEGNDHADTDTNTLNGIPIVCMALEQ